MGYAILDQRGGDSLTATTLDGYSLLADITLSTAQRTVTFSELNLSAGDEITLVSTFIGVQGWSDQVYIYFNNVTTNTSYYSQYIKADSTSAYSARFNWPWFGYTDGANTNFSNAKIKITNTNFLTYQSNLSGNLNNIYSQNLYGTSTFTSSSNLLTSITISQSNGTATPLLGAGSRFQLYKSGGGASRTWAIT